MPVKRHQTISGGAIPKADNVIIPSAREYDTVIVKCNYTGLVNISL
jgi:hypothetical protein